MLRFRHIHGLLTGACLLFALPSCASDHFFPRLKPLFAGLDENKVPAASKPALAQAKVDFQLARHGQKPTYARPAGTLPYSQSETFKGNGYTLTMVNKQFVHTVSLGPDIVLDASITGGQSYRYDEIDLVED